MSFLMEILGNNWASLCILLSQGVALLVDSVPPVFVTFGISLKEFTIQLGLNKYLVNKVYKITYF